VRERDAGVYFEGPQTQALTGQPASAKVAAYRCSSMQLQKYKCLVQVFERVYQPSIPYKFFHIVSGCPRNSPCLVQYAMGITIRSSLLGGSSAMKLACNPPSGSNLATSSTRPAPMPSHPRSAPCRGCLPTVFPSIMSRVKAAVVSLVSVPAFCPSFPPPPPPPPPL
jgi:hypothetical protein